MANKGRWEEERHNRKYIEKQEKRKEGRKVMKEGDNEEKKEGRKEIMKKRRKEGRKGMKEGDNEEKKE